MTISMLPPALGDIGMIELLECDSRPTFILDLDRPQDSCDHRLHTTFTNTALQLLPHILCPAQVEKDMAVDDDALEQFLLFKEWATSSFTQDHKANDRVTFECQNLLWVGLTLRKRWRIISAPGLDPPTGSPPSPPGGSQTGSHGMKLDFRKENGVLQTGIHTTWVDDLPVSEHVQLFKSTNWSVTALGPLETWSGCLQQMTRFLMTDSRAACMIWYKLMS